MLGLAARIPRTSTSRSSRRVDPPDMAPIVAAGPAGRLGCVAMAVEIMFATGTSVKVIAGIDEIRDAVAARVQIDTQRVAGFRGEEAVGAERVIVTGAAIAYAIE